MCLRWVYGTQFIGFWHGFDMTAERRGFLGGFRVTRMVQHQGTDGVFAWLLRQKGVYALLSTSYLSLIRLLE